MISGQEINKYPLHTPSWTLFLPRSQTSCFSVGVLTISFLSTFFFYLYQVGRNPCCHSGSNCMWPSGASWLYALGFLVLTFLKASGHWFSSYFSVQSQVISQSLGKLTLSTPIQLSVTTEATGQGSSALTRFMDRGCEGQSLTKHV